MRLNIFLFAIFFITDVCISKQPSQIKPFTPFQPPISYIDADKRADTVLAKLSTNEKLQLISGHNAFFIKGFPQYGIPELYLSDATQGVHIREDLSNKMDKSTAFPCPLSLSATWDTDLAKQYATSIGEECRSGDIAVLLGPGMNIYRVSQCGRNFEYFGEDPFLTSRMIENYVVGVQSTGTIATLKHFFCNNTDFHRRNTNSIVDERTQHEIYLPAFKAGIDAGAMAVMTSYNQLNGEWCGQSSEVIDRLLKKDLGFKGLVMTDWWSVWDTEKLLNSGQDLEMPGKSLIDQNAQRLLNEGKVNIAQIDRMAKSIIRTSISMGIYDRPVKDNKYLSAFPQHEQIALQTAREGIVLLKNQDNILPLQKGTLKTPILLTGEYVEKHAEGGGSGNVKGYNIVSMLTALNNEFGTSINYQPTPTDQQIKDASSVVVSIGTFDSEAWDRPFELSKKQDELILHIASLNQNVIVVVNTGSGVQMTPWIDKVKGLIYAWYPGQIGNVALAEILSGKTNPSGKLPISIERRFADSPGHDYIPKGDSLYSSWKGDDLEKGIMRDIKYKEGVFVGYRWYEAQKIEPLFHFGFGLSYTSFEYSNLQVTKKVFSSIDTIAVMFTIKNTGKTEGADVAQLYVQDIEASVARPVKELKGFTKILLKAGESKQVCLNLSKKDFAFWDVNTKNWKAETGDFNLMVGAASNDIRLTEKVSLK